MFIKIPGLGFDLFLNLTHRYSPVPCPKGMFSLGGASTNCTECPPRFECPSAVAIPVACTGGMSKVLIFSEKYNFFSEKY